MIQSQNPANEEVLERFDPMGAAAIEAALAAAEAAAVRQRATPLAQRAEWMNAAADLLEGEVDRWARLMTDEMGKTLASARGEAKKCAWVCRYYAEHAAAFMADEVLPSDATRSFVRHVPLGPVLAVMPWNFPFWQVFRFAAPALMAGNVGLLKHASNVPRSALAIAEIFARAGFDPGCFQTLLIGSGPVAGILADPRVKAATLTGSEGAGAAVAAQAGKHLKPTVMELGGSDPFIVMPSADLEAALDAGVHARTLNNGQSCIAAKRFLVHDAVYDRFAKGFAERFAALEVGDPHRADTDIGPLATAQVRDDLVAQVDASVKAGAQRLVGAEAMAGRGFFYRPGILADIPEAAPVYTEEVFGPVALLFRVKDFDHAVELGNATRFGLGSSVWTRDPGEIEQAADRLEAGATFINSIVASDPRLPFGGIKASGYGRELAADGLRAFVNRKTVSIA